MWGKRVAVVFMLVAVSLFLYGCGEEGTIIYKGEEMKISEAEERIADELEVENPKLDLELNIFEETDD